MKAKVLGIFLLLIVICGFLSWYTPESFLKGNNIENLLRRTSMYGILGVGVAFVIITSGIDLSLGSLVCLVACMLAILLDVRYDPIVESRVREVRGAARQIYVDGNATSFREGDVVRYYSGRARNALATVESVEDASSDGVPLTRITVDQPLSRDADDGLLAKLTSVTAVRSGDDGDDVELATSFSGVQAGDEILFVKSGGLKRSKIAAVQRTDERTTVRVEGGLGNLDDTWLATPLRRRQFCSIPVAVGLLLFFAVSLGTTHGLLVTQLNMQPFVVTLCGLLFYRGIARWLVDDATMGFKNEFDDSLRLLSTGKLPLWSAADGSDSFGIPFPFFVLLFVAGAAAVFLNRSIWGRYMLALGYNEPAARYSGIDTKRMTLLAYVICSVLAAVAGILFALDSNSIPPSSFGNFYELYAIAAAVLGGCSLRGGQGGIIGVIVGTAVMQTLYNLIVLVKISDKLEFAIIGAVILLGVMTDELIRKLAANRQVLKKSA